MQIECDNCGATEFIGTEVASAGVGGPDLLPGPGLIDHAAFTLQQRLIQAWIITEKNDMLTSMVG
jgi:hypothetical protein